MTRAFLPLSVLAILSFAACSGEPPAPSKLSLQKHGAAADHFLLRSGERVREAWSLFRNELRLTGSAAQNEVENRLQDKAREAIHGAVSGVVFPGWDEDRDMEAELDLEDAAPAPSQEALPNGLRSPSDARKQEAIGTIPSSAPASTSPRPGDGLSAASNAGLPQSRKANDGGPSPWEPSEPSAPAEQAPQSRSSSIAPNASADGEWKPTPPAFAKDWQ